MLQKLRAMRFAETIRESVEIISEPIPALQAHEVLIQNHYAGINGLFDRAIVRNELPYRFLAPPIDLGVEAIGIVVDVGKAVQYLRIGDAVSTTRFGQGYRTFQVEDEGKVWKIPALEPAYVALRPTALSALVALEQCATDGLAVTNQHHGTVAITAAAGGLGQFVVQFAKMGGNHVIGICGGAKKAAFLRTLGCDTVIDYHSEDIDTLLTERFPQGINLAYDTVGGKIFDVLVKHLAIRGRILISGYASDMGKVGLPEVVSRPRIYEQLYWKAAQLRCFQNALYTEHQADASRRILQWYADGKLSVTTDSQVFKGIEALPDAIEYHCSGQSIGKVILQF